LEPREKELAERYETLREQEAVLHEKVKDYGEVKKDVKQMKEMEEERFKFSAYSTEL